MLTHRAGLLAISQGGRPGETYGGLITPASSYDVSRMVDPLTRLQATGTHTLVSCR